MRSGARTSVQGGVPKRGPGLPDSDPMHMPRAVHVPAAGEDLERRLADLERRNAELVDFAHLTAHDLKEPLSTIALFADVLATRPLPRPEPRRPPAAGAPGGRCGADATHHRRRAGARGPGRASRGPCGHEPGRVRRAPGPGREHRDGDALVEVGPMPAVSGNRPELVRLVQNLVANSLRYVEGRPVRKISITARRADASAGSSRWRTPAADSQTRTRAPGRVSASASAGRSQNATAARSRSIPGRAPAPP